jgi:hypothetical protein
VPRSVEQLHASQHPQQPFEHAAVTSSRMQTPRTKHGDALAPGLNEVRTICVVSEFCMLTVPHKRRHMSALACGPTMEQTSRMASSHDAHHMPEAHASMCVGCSILGASSRAERVRRTYATQQDPAALSCCSIKCLQADRCPFTASTPATSPFAHTNRLAGRCIQQGNHIKSIPICGRVYREGHRSQQ